MKVSEDSDDENSMPQSGREYMEEVYEHYKSHILQPGDEAYADIYTPTMRSAQDISERIVIINKLLRIRNTIDVEKLTHLLSDLKIGWWFKLTPLEQQILEYGGFPDLQDQHSILYREILNSLLGTLNQEQTYDNAAGESVDYVIYPKLSEIEADNTSFIKDAHARPVAEILQARADNYKAYMEAKLEFDANEGDSYDLSILEFTGKYVALAWVLEEGDWDEVLEDIFERTFYLRANGVEFEEAEDGDEEDWE